MSERWLEGDDRKSLDAFQAAAALAWKADVISTRNPADYKRSPVRAAHPKALIGQLKLHDEGG